MGAPNLIVHGWNISCKEAAAAAKVDLQRTAEIEYTANPRLYIIPRRTPQPVLVE